MLKKRTKKIVFLLIMIVILFECGIVVVNVNGVVDDNGKGFEGGNLGNCGGHNCIWSGFVGVRFSLVDENGIQVPGTSHVDLWYKNDMPKWATTNYDLYDNDGKLIADFSGAYYGNQIKQDVFTNAAGLQFGHYFGLSTVQDLLTVIPGFNISFSTFKSNYRWDPEFAKTITDYVKNNTSESNTKIMDNILSALGYTNEKNSKETLSITAAKLNYYLQYEPLIFHGRVGSDIFNYIFIGSVTEYYKYDKDKSNGSNTSPFFRTNPTTTGVAIVESTYPKNFTTGTGRNVSNLLSYDANGKIYGEGVAHLWLRDVVNVDGLTCTDAIIHINEKYTTGTQEYHDAVAQVKNGTFEYVDDSGITQKIDKAYNYEFLIKENYIKYNNGYAACAEIPVDTKDCEAAVEYINKNYTKNTDEYHDAISSVRDGTFKYEVTDAKGKTTIVKIDKAYSFDMLNKSTYTRKGGTAACEDLDNICDQYDGYTSDIDDCKTGKTYFKDIDEEEAWLVCEIAYTKGGTIYSSDNTGHDAVESSNGGIVGNKEYCELFCYEDFETAFPTNVYGVKAGQTFTWGNADGTFGTVRITKKCSTQTYVKGQQGYRFEEWEEDYKANEEALIKYYMNKASYEKEKNTITTSSTGKYTACRKCSTCHRKDGSSYKCNCHYTCNYRYKGYASSSSQSHSYSHSYVGGITGSASGQSVSTGYSYTTASAAESAAKSKLISLLNSLASSELGKYNSKLTSEAALLVKIRQCTNNLEYLYKTTVQFTFQEPTNSVYGANTRGFSFDDDLELEGNYNTNNVDTSKCKKKTVYSYKCSGSGSSATCTATKQSVLDCTIVTWNITGNYTYKYPTEKFQWYSLKVDSTLVNKENKGSEDEAFFYSIGFGLPTAFSLTDGTYALKVTVNNIGDNAEMKGDQDYNRPNGHFAPITNTVNVMTGTGYGFDYSCIYQVENEIFGNDCQYDSNGKLTAESPDYCDSKKDKDSNGSLVGIDIAFRLVQLLEDTDSIDKAFPSIDGDGRDLGGNWNIGSSKIHEILDADIYKESQAMYEIMLDVNAIQYIRRDNQEYFDAGKDPYTSYVNENNTQKVYCATDSAQQKYCASDFISDLYSGSGLNYPLKGTCLPTSNTLQRAEYILEHGCDTTYTYPTIDWTR